MKLYMELARTIGALKRCQIDKSAWAERWQANIDELADKYFPHGSGFDNGCTLDLDASSKEKLIIHAPFHAMDSNGYYDGWRQYRVTVRPSLAFGATIRVAGPSSNGLKDYVTDTLQDALFSEIEGKTGSV